MRLKYEPSSDEQESQKMVRELKSDRWLDESSQWLRIDFTTYNPSANLITQVFFTLVTGPRRSLSLKLSDTRVYEP